MSINFNNPFSNPYQLEYDQPELQSSVEEMEFNVDGLPPPFLEEMGFNVDGLPPSSLETFQKNMELLLSGNLIPWSTILQSEPDKKFATLFLNIWREDYPRVTYHNRKCISVNGYDNYLGQSNRQKGFFNRKPGVIAVSGPCERYVVFLWLSYFLPANKESRFGGLSNFLNVLPIILKKMEKEELGFNKICNTSDFFLCRLSSFQGYTPAISPSFVELLHEWMCQIEGREQSEFESFFEALGYSIGYTKGPEVLGDPIPIINMKFEDLVKKYMSISIEKSLYSDELEKEIIKRTFSSYFLDSLKDYKKCKIKEFQILENSIVKARSLVFDSYVLNFISVFGFKPDDIYGYCSIFIKILIDIFYLKQVDLVRINNFINLLPFFLEDLLFFDGRRNKIRINVESQIENHKVSFFECLYKWMKSEGKTDELDALLKKRGFGYRFVNQTPEVYPIEESHLKDMPDMDRPIMDPMVVDDEIIEERVPEKDPLIQKSLKDYLFEQKDHALKNYSQLVKILKNSWFSSDSLKGTVVQALMRAQGKWQLVIESQKELEVLLAPLTAFIKKAQNDKVTKEILKDFFSCFPISCPNLDIPNEITPYIFEGEEITGSVLSKKVSREVAQSFLNLKISEFLLRSLHLESFFQTESRAPRQIPCFLIEQNKNLVHADLMIAHFNEYNSLIALTADSEKFASEYLKIQEREVQIQRDDEGCTSTFSLETLKNLRLSITLSQGIPSALFLQRVNITDALALDTIENKKTAKIKKDNLPNKPSKTHKRKREVEIDAQGNDILDSLTETKKQKTDDNSIISQANQQVGYSGLKLQGAYKSFTESPDISNRMDIEKDSPELEGLPTLPSTKKKEAIIPEKELDLINFWEQINLLALETVESKVAEQEILSQALQSKALDYPILESLEALKRSRVENVPSFNPLLKPYQREEINQILHFAKMKISRLLAFEMGLGKTFVFSEFISQMIAQKEGVVLVVVPKSLLDTVGNEISRAVTFSLAHAYKALGKTTKVLNGIVSEVKSLLEKGDKERLKPLVQLFSLFEKEELKIRLETEGCFVEKYSSTWVHLKEVLRKDLSRLIDKPDLVKNAMSAAVEKSQNISRLPSRKTDKRTKWE